MNTILTPALALCVWTFVLLFWLFATRMPAMKKARINVHRLKRKHELEVLPVAAQQVADNYNHLHEQPTLFYALVFYSHLVGVADTSNILLAWLYVFFRVIHSLIQCTNNYVPLRFMVFVAASIVLMIICARNVLALMV
jgi:hypothetical protein